MGSMSLPTANPFATHALLHGTAKPLVRLLYLPLYIMLIFFCIPFWHLMAARGIPEMQGDVLSVAHPDLWRFA